MNRKIRIFVPVVVIIDCNIRNDGWATKSSTSKATICLLIQQFKQIMCVCVLTARVSFKVQTHFFPPNFEHAKYLKYFLLISCFELEEICLIYCIFPSFKTFSPNSTFFCGVTNFILLQTQTKTYNLCHNIEFISIVKHLLIHNLRK